jgi:hypothetical protein
MLCTVCHSHTIEVEAMYAYRASPYMPAKKTGKEFKCNWQDITANYQKLAITKKLADLKKCVRVP